MQLKRFVTGLLNIAVLIAVTGSLCANDNWFQPPATSQTIQRLPATHPTVQRFDQVQPTNYNHWSNASADEKKSDDTDPAWSVLYDKGFLIKPKDKQKNPFQLKVNGRIQFRHTAFIREQQSYLDRASGNIVRIEPRNDYEIERGRIAFGGHVHNPKLQFYVQIDFDTDDNHRAVAQDFWFNYKFSDAFNLYAGKAFIPGSRDWLAGALAMRFGDRSMPTTFFRPDRTVGLWAIGEPVEGFHYRTMIGNGFQTADTNPANIDDNFMYSISTWCEPLGEFGSGYSDMGWHCTPVVRIGNSFTYAKQSPDASGTPHAEQNFVRLSDGVRLVDTGALAPGVRVNEFDVYLYAADIAMKWRGFSFNSEYFMRWLTDIGADGPTGISKIYDHGFYFATGYMLIPQTFEINGRIGVVDGAYGDHWEYAGGINWFFHGHNNKFTLDVTHLDGSPANNSGANYRRGDNGIMIRSAWQVAF